jgi:hypothetical protein
VGRRLASTIAPAKAVKGTRAASLPPTTPPPHLLKRHALSCRSILSEHLGCSSTKIGCGALCGASPGARCQVANITCSRRAPQSPHRPRPSRRLRPRLRLRLRLPPRSSRHIKHYTRTIHSDDDAFRACRQVNCSSPQKTSHHFPVQLGAVNSGLQNHLRTASVPPPLFLPLGALHAAQSMVRKERGEMG